MSQRPRNRQEERSLRTRERLAEAAIACLVERGYRGTTFVEVCRRAGLTRGAAHHHYRDLAALMLDAVRRVNERLLDGASPVLADFNELGKRVDAFLEVLWEVASAREFRALIEIWLAQSHDLALRTRLRSEASRFAAEIVGRFARLFPKLADGGGEEAARLVHVSFLMALGVGFAQATLFPPPRSPEWGRMLALLQRMVRRELALHQAGEGDGARVSRAS